MKNEFFKPYVLQVQIKTEYHNSEEVKTDFVSDKEVVAELGFDDDFLYFQLTYDADIRHAKERILERRKKKSIQCKILKASTKFGLIDHTFSYLRIFSSKISFSKYVSSPHVAI